MSLNKKKHLGDELRKYNIQKEDTALLGLDFVFDGSLRIATFNIAHGRGTGRFNISHAFDRHARLKQIAEILKVRKIDIAILQEVDFDAAWSGYENQAEFIARTAGYTHILEQRNFNIRIPFAWLRWGNAILSNYEISNEQIISLPVYSPFEAYFFGSKQAVQVDIKIANHLIIRVLAVHLEHRSEAIRIRCADKILALMKRSPIPFFCIGDFNSSPTYHTKVDMGSKQTLMDILLKEGQFNTRPKGLPTADELTWPSWNPRSLDDWVLSPADWTILNYQTYKNDLSDHRAIMATIKPPSSFEKYEDSPNPIVPLDNTLGR